MRRNSIWLAWLVVVAVGTEEVAANPSKPTYAADCIPNYASRLDYHGITAVQLARVAGKLVVCGWGTGVGGGKDELRACWNLDASTGALSRHDTKPLPGAGFPVTGCYQGLCPKTKDAAHLLAVHADGRRAASVSASDVVVFDVASKKITASFKVRGAADRLWFVGDTIFLGANTVEGALESITQHGVDGSEAGPAVKLAHGGVGITSDALVVQDVAATKVVVLDGKKTVTSVGPRAIPPAPKGCALPTTWDGDWGRRDACTTYLAAHYRAYAGTQLVPDGTRLIGFTGPGKLVYLDGKTLAPIGKTIDVKVCPDKPHGPG